MSWARFPRVLGIAVVVYFLALTVFFAVQTSQRFLFLDRASSVTGTVVALEPRTVGVAARRTGPAVATVPRVSYQVGGQTYEVVGERAHLHQRLRVGDRMTVRYDPTRPSRAALLGEGRYALPLITVGFAACAAGVVVLLVLTRRRRR